MTARLLAMPVNRSAEAVAIDSTAEAPLTDAFLDAIAALKLTDRELAGLLRMSPTQLSRQKTNSEGHYLQVQRFDVLPADRREAFARALLQALARQLGVTLATPQTQMQAIAAATRALADAMEQMSALGQQPLPLFHERRKEIRHA